VNTVSFLGELYDVRMKRNGGGRLTIDFGGDAFEEILRVQRFFKDNNISVAMALEPYISVTAKHPSETHKEPADDQ
jgi:hypothetical protein